jgi:hypothetical protein
MWLAQEPGVPASRSFCDNEQALSFRRLMRLVGCRLLDKDLRCYGTIKLEERYTLRVYPSLNSSTTFFSRSAPNKMDQDEGRPVISPSTPGPGLAILCLCSAGASALVAGTAVLYQARLKRTNFKDLQMNWNVLLALGLVRIYLSSWMGEAYGLTAELRRLSALPSLLLPSSKSTMA